MPKHGKIVISIHDWPQVHWDMFVDFDSASERVATWALDHLPGTAALSGQATKLADHRRIYLSYEGEISDGRGRVSIESEGEFETEQSANDKEIQLSLKIKSKAGKSISGLITLNAVEVPVDQKNGRTPVVTKNAWLWSWMPE
jgi:hypothetical protein